MKEKTMKSQKIVRSQITSEGVEVVWNDGTVYTFDASNLNNFSVESVGSSLGVKGRATVSQTSARATLDGCGVC
jgi:hypothetical protein